MGDVVKLRHATSRRAASLANSSAVKPADRAFRVRKIGSHHSGGMLSRDGCPHLRAASTDAPISDAKASGVFQSCTTSRKLETMLDTLGQSVPNVKAIASHDIGNDIGHDVRMGHDEEEEAERAWREAFRDRIRAIQGTRSQEQMGDLLGISRDAYSKYVGSRCSQMPIRLLPKLAAIGEMSVEELILGPKVKPASAGKPLKKRKAS